MGKGKLGEMGEDAGAGMIRTRSGRLIPAGQALSHAAPKGPPENASSGGPSLGTLIGVGLGLALLFVGLAWLIAAGEERANGTSSSFDSVLKDVGYVIRSAKGVGIER